MDANLSLGEYLRRLRRAKRWTLQQLADESDLSYTHLSRIENDSTLPNATTVTRLADALDGDLPLMLEMANCLPQAIVNRISGLDTASSPRLMRAAVGAAPSGADNDDWTFLVSLALRRGLSREDAELFASGVEQLLRLPAEQRRALLSFSQTLTGEGSSGAK